MSFIGIVSDNKCFDVIKNRLKDLDCSNKINVIHINNKSIENMKNIKFDVIVINNDFKKIENYENTLKKICSKADYILINTDMNKTFNISEKENKKIITYGLNRDSTVTISSIGESEILIYIQRNIKDKENKILDIQEKRVKLDKTSKCKIYEVMVIYIILTIYCHDIDFEI